MWWYEQAGAQRGPVDPAGMRERVRDGIVTRDTPVWTHGMADWAKAGASALAELFPSEPAPTPTQPVAETPSPARAPSTDGAGGGRPLQILWAWLRGLLIAYLVVSIAYLVALGGQIAVLERMRIGGFGSDDAMMTAATISDGLIALTGLAYFVTFIWCAFLWLRLTYRAMRNLHRANAQGLTISPGWAVGWYFIPIAWLWKPLQAVRQIWRSSAAPDRPESVPVPAQIGWWWTFWLVGNFVGYASLRMALAQELDVSVAPDPAAMQATYWIDVVTTLLDVPLVLLALWFWKRIAQLQDSRLAAAAFG
jgi:hypothetical protein